MNILGLNIGHNATACLLQDGRIINCASEERFSRIKNHHGIPFKAIEFVLRANSIKLKDVDLIVLDDQYPIERNPNFGKHFLHAYKNKSMKKKLFSYLGYKYPKIFKRYYNIKESIFNKEKHRESIKNDLSSILAFPSSKIIIAEHHLMHAFSTLGNLGLKKKWLIFTLDGEGSGLSASVNIYDGKNVKRISESSKTASLGYFYGLATLFLGMKPLEHEFKVMGLAPYAKPHSIEEFYPIIRNLFNISDDLRFNSKFSMPFSDYFFREKMKFVRFDTLAACVQKLTEELCCEWVLKAIETTKISNIALSGGVFMNVKANKKISELEKVKEIFVMPSCGDEANAIGSCFYGYKLFCERKNITFSPKPLTHLYLGPEYDEEYIKNLIEEKNLSKKYKITKQRKINLSIAKLLARGEIVARCSGKSEWGARALGNRSILANPLHKNTIKILNETIKDRDFWMPFTPSILDRFEEDYLVNPKKIFSPYMAITFDSTSSAREKLPAAMHPYDQTIRPQIVTKEFNEEYYEIISNFQKLTGTGAILNTSFNLHGKPNVLSPEDALHTLDNSSLRYLALGNYLFEKKS